jgi:hypothetical protein
MNRRLGAHGRKVAAVILGLLVTMLIGGCDNASIASDLAGRLGYEGYGDVTVQLRSGADGDTVTIRTRGNVRLSDQESIESLQTTVWNSLPRRFDTLDIRVGREQRKASYQLLSQRFGPRDRSLDERPIRTDVSAVVVTVSLVTGIVVVVLAVVAFMLFRRRRWEEREQTERLELGPPPPAGYSPPALS